MLIDGPSSSCCFVRYTPRTSSQIFFIFAQLCVVKRGARESPEPLWSRHARPTNSLPSCALSHAVVVRLTGGAIWCLCFQGTVQQIANGDLLRPLLIECWDYDRAGGHDFIGACSASIMDMQVRRRDAFPFS